jgi:hypothetical protein
LVGGADGSGAAAATAGGVVLMLRREVLEHSLSSPIRNFGFATYATIHHYDTLRSPYFNFNFNFNLQNISSLSRLVSSLSHLKFHNIVSPHLVNNVAINVTTTRSFEAKRRTNGIYLFLGLLVAAVADFTVISALIFRSTTSL